MSRSSRPWRHALRWTGFTTCMITARCERAACKEYALNDLVGFGSMAKPPRMGEREGEVQRLLAKSWSVE